MFEAATEAPASAATEQPAPTVPALAVVESVAESATVEPRDKSRRRRKAEAEAVRRRLKKLKGLDTDKLDKLIERADEPAPVTPAAPVEVRAESKPPEPGQKKGWPAPSRIAAMLPHAETGLTAAKTLLPERYASRLLPVSRELPGEDGQKITVTFDPAALLAEPLAACAADIFERLNAGDEPTSPYSAVIGISLMIWGPPLGEDAWAAFQQWNEKRKAAAP